MAGSKLFWQNAWIMHTPVIKRMKKQHARVAKDNAVLNLEIHKMTLGILEAAINSKSIPLFLNGSLK